VNEKTHQLLEELEGYCELGMQDSCLPLARKLLGHTLDAAAFGQVVHVALIYVDHLKPWRKSIESAYARLPVGEQSKARQFLVYFYVSIKDWESADRFISRQPKVFFDCLFGMWTFLHLKKKKESQKLFHRMLGMFELEPDVDDTEASCFLEAAACFMAARGQLDIAEQAWELGAEFEYLRENAWTGLIEIHIAEAQKRVRIAAALPTGADDFFISSPGLDGQRRGSFKNRITALRSTLDRVLPEKELWRYGIKMR
jgi:hypothetical protein